MSDLLTHWAVFEDCRRLTWADERVDRELATIMEEEREYARLGAISRGGSKVLPRLLEPARAARREGALDELRRRKLAFGLGLIAHYGADVMMKPLASRVARQDWHQAHVDERRGDAPDSPIRDVSPYYDAHVFRQVYLAGQEEPFNAFLLAQNHTEPGRALEDFAYSLFQRALLASHTLAPDHADLDAWLDNLLERVQPLYIDVRTFVAAYQSPDPEKMRAYGVETEFYRADDPAIAIARAVQAGATPTATDLAAALAEGANHSGYARAVCRNLERYRQVSAYWQGHTDTTPDIRQGGKH